MIVGTTERTTQGGFTVHIGLEFLNPRPSQKLVNHSPDGFAWGYGGSGPAQLALAILLWFRGNTDKDWCLRYYQQFKQEVIAFLPSGDFALSERAVKNWIKNHSEAAS